MIKQPLLTVKFIARTPVMYILNGHSGVYVATDQCVYYVYGQYDQCVYVYGQYL
jgi:hypothetical protein